MCFHAAGFGGCCLSLSCGEQAFKEKNRLIKTAQWKTIKKNIFKDMDGQTRRVRKPPPPPPPRIKKVGPNFPSLPS